LVAVEVVVVAETGASVNKPRHHRAGKWFSQALHISHRYHPRSRLRFVTHL
jgi:hypothetical protein